VKRALTRARALTRCRALVARAQGTTFEEEARTCALLAVQLMREHGFRVVLSEDRERAPRRPPPPDRDVGTLACVQGCNPRDGHAAGCPRQAWED
jgi:hypothetical protein